MTFEVIPALDVAHGRVVRLEPAGRVPVEVFGADPITAAIAFFEAGARRMHLVDVDLAESGHPRNVEVLRALSELDVPVQASGGVRTGGQVDDLLAAGAQRVVLGSAALTDRDEARELVRVFGDRLVVGIEVDGSTVRPRGSNVELPLPDLLPWLSGVGVRRYLFTEVGRVGSLRGPDLDGIWAFSRLSAAPVLVAGGIRGIEDLRGVARLGGPIEGAIVGRALYEGTELRRALAADL